MGIKVNGVQIASIGKPGRDGSPGKSAYEYAKEGGYAGTEDEFKLKMAESLNMTLISLNANNWTETNSSYIQTIAVNGILADETKQSILVTPYNNKNNIILITENSIYCSAQGENSLTFSAERIPTESVQFIIEWQSVKYMSN